MLLSDLADHFGILRDRAGPRFVRIALQNASSIAGLLLTTDSLVAELPEEEKAPKYPAPPGGDMY
jgi:chaperonin GroEL